MLPLSTVESVDYSVCSVHYFSVHCSILYGILPPSTVSYHATKFNLRN